MSKKPETAVSEADAMLQTLARLEAAQNHVRTVVQESVVQGLNVNTVRAHVRNRPFGVPLSGRTAHGHRGFTFWDSLMLRMGRKAMSHGIRSDRVQFFVDHCRALINPYITRHAEARERGESDGGEWVHIFLSNDLMIVWGEGDTPEELQAKESQLREMSQPGIRLDLTVEIHDLGERIRAMLEHREYQEPEIVKMDREYRKQQFIKALASFRPRVTEIEK